MRELSSATLDYVEPNFVKKLNKVICQVSRRVSGKTGYSYISCI